MTRLIALSLFSMRLLMLFSTVLLPLQAAQMRPGERLEYTFSYQGILSGFMQMNIAHAVFDVQSAIDSIQGRDTYLTTLDLTTEPYGKAEMIYPIRYRYRSWLEPEQQIPLLVNEYLETDDVSEELLWFDRKNHFGYRYVIKDGRTEPEAKQPPGFLLDKIDLGEADGKILAQEDRQAFPEKGVWDYLSMLYRLRFLDLEAGRVFELPLYNGKRIKHYQVEVTREHMTQAGWNRPAYKLSLSEGKRKRDSITSVWVSDDDERLPLRFYVQRTFGAVEGILETGRPSSVKKNGFSTATNSSLGLIL